MAYATPDDVQALFLTDMTEKERDNCEVLLDRAALLIDSFGPDADLDRKKTVSCSVVARMLSSERIDGVPMGATQGNMTALGYTQGWTISSGGTAGEMYLTRTEKILLGHGNRIGASNPFEDLVEGTA